MAKFKVGQAVWIKNRKKIGIISKVDNNGNPQKVEIDGEIYNTVGLIFEVVSLLKLIWLGLKSIFKKKK